MEFIKEISRISNLLLQCSVFHCVDCLSDYTVQCTFYLQVLDKHKAMDSMVELLQVYPEEDEAYGELLEATTQLYHYLLQPFRDMRELAMLRRQQIKVIHTGTLIQIPSV